MATSPVNNNWSQTQLETSCDVCSRLLLLKACVAIADDDCSTGSAGAAAVVAGTHASAGAAAATENSSDGVWVWLTLPSCLMFAMAKSPVNNCWCQKYLG